MEIKRDFKSRKLLISLGIMVTCTTLLLFHYVDSAQWVDLIKWVFGIYAAGNVGEHMSNKKVV